MKISIFFTILSSFLTHSFISFIITLPDLDERTLGIEEAFESPRGLFLFRDTKRIDSEETPATGPTFKMN